MHISDRVENISSSQSLAMAARANAMRSSGIDVISMSLGEPDMDTPVHIRKAAQEAIDNHWSHYGAVAGIVSLRGLIAERQNGVAGNSIEWLSEDVIVTVGAKMAIYNAIQSCINPGDEVIIPMPSWVSYSEMVKLAGGIVVPIETRYEDKYCMSGEQLRSAISPRTRLIILCSPNNPTGSVYSREQLEELVEVLRGNEDIAVLSDEIYSSLCYNGAAPSMSSFSELEDRLIVINGVSKSYAMTGYRIGWLMSKNVGLLKACTRLQGQELTCATMVSQKAAEAALSGGERCIDEMRDVFRTRRSMICRLAGEIRGFRFHEPDGAFYLFVDVSEIGSGDEVSELLLEKAHVAVVSGSAFGCGACIRLSYAISTDEIKEAMRRIKETIENI